MVVSRVRPPPSEASSAHATGGVPSAAPRRRGEWLGAAARMEWRELGGLGRLAFLGVGASLALALVLGFAIPDATEGHLLDARMENLEATVDGLVLLGLLPTEAGEAPGGEAFDEAIDHWLLGSDTVRMKLWRSDGMILYSDAEALIGDRFALSERLRRAFAGEGVVGRARLDEPENAHERAFGPLLEFYLPVRDDDGEVVAVFEAYQRAEAFYEAIAKVNRHVWLSIGTGLAVLGVFMGTLTLAHVRALDRRRRQAEHLLGSLVRAQDEERRQVIGLLHDDVGQPLYRLIYGIEGCRARIGEYDPIAAAELSDLTDLARGVDRTLRTRLGALHTGLFEDLRFTDALETVSRLIAQEGGLGLEIDFQIRAEPASLIRTVILRTAQEALINVRRHADASRVWVSVRERGDRLDVTVADDGVGFDGPEGLGLRTARQRLEAAGGGLEVVLRPGGGTVVRAWVPVEDAGEPGGGES